MKWAGIALALSVSAFASVAFAGADDTKWIAKCMQDNGDAKVSAAVVSKYCACMNDKMDSNETLSISAWEKSHPKEMAMCERESGWK